MHVTRPILVVSLCLLQCTAMLACTDRGSTRTTAPAAAQPIPPGSASEIASEPRAPVPHSDKRPRGHETAAPLPPDRAEIHVTGARQFVLRSEEPALARLSQPAQAEIDTEIAALRTASIAFDTPAKIGIHETVVVTLNMSFDLSQAELKGLLGSAGPSDSAQIPAAPEMQATLLPSSGLNVTPLQSDSPKVVPSTGVAYWKWNVEGSARGRHTLALTITAVMIGAPGMPGYNIKTFSRDLEVEVSAPEAAREFAADNWQWLWTVLVVPLAGLLWRFFRGGKEATAKS